METLEHLDSSKFTLDVTKTPSQWTYTLFADGHWERSIFYTDGSHDYAQGTIGRNPRHAPPPPDLKHGEWVWRNNAWVPTVAQYY